MYHLWIYIYIDSKNAQTSKGLIYTKFRTVVISGKGGSESFNYSVSLKNILNCNTLVIPPPHTQFF